MTDPATIAGMLTEDERRELEFLRSVIDGTWWTIENQAAAKALCDAVRFCDLGPSDDEGMLQIYDIIPEVWCVPDRITVTANLAENIAFAALDAWLFVVRERRALLKSGEA